MTESPKFTKSTQRGIRLHCRIRPKRPRVRGLPTLSAPGSRMQILRLKKRSMAVAKPVPATRLNTQVQRIQYQNNNLGESNEH
jgi:hypothetical protein